MRRLLVAALLVGVLAEGGLVAIFLWPAPQPPLPAEGQVYRADPKVIAESPSYFLPGPGEGDPAPDFTLPALAGDQVIRLGDLRGRKPLVLIFGSFSCIKFCPQMGRLDKFYHDHKDRAAFLIVYIGEAGHHIPGLEYVLPKDGPPPTLAERRAVLRRAAGQLGVTLPMAIDGDDHAVALAYKANPQRMLLIGRDGRIARDMGFGMEAPWDLDAVRAWLEALPGTPSPPEARR